MSSIEDIIKVERDAATQLDSAKKNAEEIKQTGREEADKIIADAKNICKEQYDDIINEVIQKQLSEESVLLKELDDKLKSRSVKFQERADKVADWIVSRVTGNDEQ